MTDYLNDLYSVPLWKPEVLWNEIPTWDFDFERQILEFDGTSQEMIAFSQKKPHRFSFVASQFGKAEEKAMLDFFVARKGRLERFWFPLPLSLFDTTQNPPGSGQYKLLNWDFQGYERVYIQRRNGDFFTKKVSYDNDWYVSWEIPDGEAIQVGLLILARFESDILEITHLSCDITETKIALLELVSEYSELGD